MTIETQCVSTYNRDCDICTVVSEMTKKSNKLSFEINLTKTSISIHPNIYIIAMRPRAVFVFRQKIEKEIWLFNLGLFVRKLQLTYCCKSCKYYNSTLRTITNEDWYSFLDTNSCLHI